MKEERIIRKERRPGSNFDVLETEAGPDEVYVDGSVGNTIGPAVIKTDFFTISGFKREGEVAVEQRLVKLRLIMPTATFLEMCVKNLAALKANEATMNQVLEQQTEAIRKHISSVISAEPEKEK